MLLMLLGTCWILAASFMAFQYHREKEYKADLLNTRLQMHNARIIEDLRGAEAIDSIVSRINTPAENLRVTLIDYVGNVIYDSKTPRAVSNHNSRPEVLSARIKGEGHSIERLSESDDTNYFYSARLGEGGIVVRSAAPYTHTLSEFLAVDSNIFWIMGAITLLVTIMGWLATRRISVSISRLNKFAEKAEQGGEIYDGYAFPHDELGNIAANIVKLYVQREEQHRETFRLEQEKSRLKKQLTNNINHELKTPVASMLVSLDILDDHPDISEEKKRELLGRVRANAERLSALLKDVSTITRLEDAPEMIEKKPVDITKLVNEVADEARLRTEMAINVDLPPMKVIGDCRLLESVFRNLIDNAITYSGGTEIRITADKDGNFRVWDNGHGIAPEHLPRIFERFYRVDDGRARINGGTGLGLSIVRNAVAAHGGTIHAVNAHGLHFDFNLPVVQS